MIKHFSSLYKDKVGDFLKNNILDEKLEHWKHRLLDLTKRNKMIHYKPSIRSALRITTPNFQDLYSKLVELEETLSFQHLMDRETDIRLFSFLTLLEELSAPLVVSVGDMKADVSFDETNKTLKNLRNKSRISIEEKGSNILYLSFGFLDWRTLHDDWVKSPLILVPVTLLLPSLNAPYQLKKHVDEVLINPTLNFYFKTKYGITLPIFTEHEDTPTEYLKTIEELANQRGWKINKEVSLGLLSFQKISMYNDLIHNEERIKNSPIIRAMAEGIDETEEVFQLPEHIVDFDLDTMPPQESFQVMSADSSQQDAILYSKNNISFVMQGPPGTGKSQTIANIIAEALAADKKILFVAEKATALQVVLQRLSDVNLADFCLTLHNSESKKRSILDDLDANLKLKHPKVKELAWSQLDELSFLRDDLNSYVKELHQTISPLGISCYEASGRLTDLLPYPALSFPIENAGNITQTELNSYTKVLKEYSNAVERLAGNLKNNPWEGLVTRIAGYEFSETMKNSLTQVIFSLDSNIACFLQIPEFSAFSSTISSKKLVLFLNYVDKFWSLPDVPSHWFPNGNVNDEIDQYLLLALESCEELKILRRLESSLFHIYSEEIRELNIIDLEETLRSFIKSLCDSLGIEGSNQGFFENIDSIHDSLQATSRFYTRIEDIFNIIREMFGVEWASTVSSLDVLHKLLIVLGKNRHPSKEMFLVSKENMEEFAQLGAMNSSELKKNRKVISDQWEESIFELDILPLVQRFKLHYTEEFLEKYELYEEDISNLKKVYKGDDFSDTTVLNVLDEIVELEKIGVLIENELETYKKSCVFQEYFLEKRESSFQLGVNIYCQFEKINTCMNEVAVIFCEINQLLGLNLDTTVNSLLLLTHLIKLLEQDCHPNRELFFLNQSLVEEKLQLGEEKTEQLHAISDVIRTQWKESIFDVEIIDLSQRFQEDYTEEFLKNYQQYLDDYGNLKKLYLGSSFTMKSIRDMILAFKNFLITCQQIKAETKDYEVALKFVSLYDDNELAVKGFKDRILEDWEKEVLLPENLELFQRFSSEYDGFKNQLSRNYRIDKKEIQSLYLYSDKITPELVEESLELLEAYAIQAKWLAQHRPDYENNRLTINKHKKLLKQSTEAKENISSLWNFKEISKCYDEYSKRYNIVYNKAFRDIYRNYTEDLKILKVHRVVGKNSVNYNAMTELLSNLQAYKLLKTWFQEHEEEFKNMFSNFYSAQFTSWKSVEENIEFKEKLSELLQITVPEPLITLLENNYEREVEILKSCSDKITDLLEQCNCDLHERSEQQETISLEDDVELLENTSTWCKKCIEKLLCDDSNESTEIPEFLSILFHFTQLSLYHTTDINHHEIVTFGETCQQLLGNFTSNYIRKAVDSFEEDNDCQQSTDDRVESILTDLLNYEIMGQWLLEQQANYNSGSKKIATYNEHRNQANELRDRIELLWECNRLLSNNKKYCENYHTLYNADFKANYESYLADLRTLKAHHKEFKIKITYELGVDLLTNLLEYKRKEQWFLDTKTEYEKFFGKNYKEHETLWNVLEEDIAFVSEIQELFLFSVPEKLISIFDTDYLTKTAMLEAHLMKISDLLQQNSEISSKNSCVMIKFSETLSFSEKNIKLQTSLEFSSKALETLAEVSVYFKTNSSQISDTIKSWDELKELSRVSSVLEKKGTLLGERFGELYKKEETPWDDIISLLKLLSELQTSDLFSTVVPTLLAEKKKKDEMSHLLNQVKKNLALCANAQKWLFSNFSEEYGLNILPLPELSTKLKDCFENIDYLLPWIDYEEVKSQCISMQLGEFIMIVEESETFQHIDKVFLREFYTRWLDIVGSQFDFVRKFRRNNQDSNVNKFVELDQLQWTIAQSRIRAKLVAELPTEQQKLSKAKDELSILRRELDKKRKLLPLRSLFKSIPNLLLRLKPCLMMSPLSVATLLEAESYEFDLLIFDEASQIFPEDAIGSLLRAKQVIVAGDSKQLPPSNFFNANGSDSSNDDYDTEDQYYKLTADSILEESVKILPNRTLRWHYRSKYESLITFSNRELYKNKLITFPSKEMLEHDVGLEFVYVEDGYYESGTTKSFNTKEAEKCTELVHKHILTQPKRTLGIIAFSQKQQAAIESKINKFREKNPQFEYFFDESKHEPFFVKNLENVQGDERDTILFSVGYAKEQGKDKMAMRFGPLSQSGGERRLNVAITRAKYNMKLIASILPADFNITENSPEGTKLLRSFIEFARLQSDEDAPITTKERDNSYDSEDFVQSISSFLQSRGYVTKEYVGTSDYKIDIAVENPHRQGEFSVAIECDGICYFEANTARDRDHLRASMLDAMGWKKYRVWSTEWVRNTDKEETALLKFMEQAYSEDVTEPLEQKQQDSSFELLTMTDFLEESGQVTEDIDKKNPFGFAFYESFAGFEATDFCNMYDYNKIGANLIKILSVESPLPLDLLSRKVLPTLKLEKLTASVKKTLNVVITKVIQDEIWVDEEDFVWILPKMEAEVRIPNSEVPERNIDQITTVEVSNALFVLAEYLYGPSVSDLTIELGHVYGFGRSSKKIKEKVEEALKLLLHENKLKIIDDKVMVIK